MCSLAEISFFSKKLKFNDCSLKRIISYNYPKIRIYSVMIDKHILEIIFFRTN